MIRTDNTETLANALKRIEELEKENEDLKNQIRGVKVKMTNAEKFIKEIAHDILCADSESGSDIVHHLPFEVSGYFDTSYDDENIFSLVKWLQSEYKSNGKGDLTGADLVEIGMLP